MHESPWLTIIGVGEDGRDGLPPASQAALDVADVVVGPPRHLGLLSGLSAKTIAWPVPFADGLPMLMDLRGQNVVVLASGDPFWFGAGSTLARELEPGEWRALPGASTFSLAAAKLGWPLETTLCLGLHAAPFARLRQHLAPGVRTLVLLRDGDAPAVLAAYLTQLGFGQSQLHVMELLGGPHERQTSALARDLDGAFSHPVCVAVEVAGDGVALPQSSGLPDDTFSHDGQITKRPMRAITLSSLAPKPGEHLWDIGAGSGSIALEWLLAHPTTTATAIEAKAERAKRIAKNALALGVENRLHVLEGEALQVLGGLTSPQAIFVGGGVSQSLLETLMQHQARIVANAVTLEGEALLAHWHASHGGELLRIDLASAAPLGSKRGWRASYPVVQWSVSP